MVEGNQGRPGIGREKGERLVFGVILRLPSSASFTTAAGKFVEYCGELEIEGLMRPPDCDVVASALTQVGLTIQP
jgi:hypothetical protein